MERPPAVFDDSTGSFHRLPSLDGFRAIAVMMVVGYHAMSCEGFPGSWYEPWRHVWLGPLGVRIFFVLSGFLITGLLLQEERESGSISLRNFYVRRVLRLFPVYYAFLGAVAVWQVMGGVQIPASSWIAALTFTTNHWGFHQVFGHLWSLAVEWQFYLFWPLAMCLFRGKARATFAGVLISAAPVFRVLDYLRQGKFLHGISVESPLLVQMDLLMIGALVAMCLQTYPAGTSRMLKGWPTLGRAVAIIIVLTLEWLRMHHLLGWFTVPFGTPLQGLMVAYLILSTILVPRGVLFRVLNFKGAIWIGLVSYGIYVWQQPFTTLHGPDALPLARFPWFMVLAPLLGGLSWLLLERPVKAVSARFRWRGHKRALPS